METKVQRWGTSLAVRIPKAFAAQLALDSDSIIDLRIEGRTLVAQRVVPGPVVQTLDELLDGVTPENTHPETDWGTDVGAEIVEW
ncbi:MAG: AbrB/MazE/SpoVT family DNA-binding domain-containing protein [Dehalococcoidia bacterium]